MVEYSKTKTNPDIALLQTEIEADPGIAPTCQSIDFLGPDQLTIRFDVALSGAEETTLDTIITNHTAPTSIVASNGLPKNYIDGLKISYVTASSINIESGECRTSLNECDIIVPSTLTADITTSGKDGLDTGTESGDTWYAIFVICDKADVNTPASLLSLSANSPTLPSGYDTFRRIGWVRNNGSSNFIEFLQRGTGRDRKISYLINYQALAILSGGTANTFTDVDMSSFVPSTSLEVFLISEYNPNVGGQWFELRPNGMTSIDPPWFYGGVGSAYFFVEINIPCDNSQIIEYRRSGGAATVGLDVIGYIDNL